MDENTTQADEAQAPQATSTLSCPGMEVREILVRFAGVALRSARGSEPVHCSNIVEEANPCKPGHPRHGYGAWSFPSSSSQDVYQQGESPVCSGGCTLKNWLNESPKPPLAKSNGVRNEVWDEIYMRIHARLRSVSIPCAEESMLTNLVGQHGSILFACALVRETETIITGPPAIDDCPMRCQ